MLGASGIGTYLQNLIPSLAQAFDVRLLGNPEEVAKLNLPPSTKVIAPKTRIYTIKEQWELYKFAPTCDIFWSPHYNIPLLPVPAHKRVVTIHDTYHLAFQHTLSLAQRLYCNLLLWAGSRVSDKVITVSEFSKKELQKYLNLRPADVEVIHNGLDKEIFRQLDKVEAQTALKQSIPNLPEGKFILYVGNVKPHKNLSTLVKAFSGLLETLDEKYTLVIVGKKDGFITSDQNVFKLLQANHTLNQRVFFTGQVSEKQLQLLYNSASLFVFPSLYEGFGLPPLEAMACGCPVIVSETASMPEVCADAALYFPPSDASILEHRMHQALTNEILRSDLIERGLKQIELYSWQQSAIQHQRVFESLLKT
ncbi:glycosyltransferase family 1 protein [Pontibacter oryzae]|uniref:Glycosyltransferase family 1 protein n=2 Tax=Pontibacter oryzae TaxID=2304593 RepID=A0A399SG09_9BACT|nr:glycosyltransferase family 1 protein [Pontibacter oryzae]